MENSCSLGLWEIHFTQERFYDVDIKKRQKIFTFPLKYSFSVDTLIRETRLEE